MSSEGSTSQTEITEKTEAKKRAADVLAQGKRNMVCGEIPKAVSLFEEAVKILVDSCGELSRDCADAYFSCGGALLELGRMESNVLGAALDGVDIEEEKDNDVPSSEQFEKPPADEGEREKLRLEVYEAMSEEERGNILNETNERGDNVKKLDLETGTDVKGNVEKTKGTPSKETNQDEMKMDIEESKDAVDTQCKEKEVEGHEVQNGCIDSESAEKTVNKKTLESNGVEDCLKDVVNIVSKEMEETEDKTTEKSTVNETVKSTDAKEETKENIPKESKDKDEIEKSPVKLLQKENLDNDNLAKAGGEEEDETKMDNLAKAGGEEGETKMDNAAKVGGEEEGETKMDNVAKTGKEEEDETKMETDENGEEAKNEGTEEDTAEEAGDAEDSDGAAEGSQEGEESAKGGDEVDNFQLAWEYLDLAKVIYKKSEIMEDQLKAAECLLKLGEVSMETELYEQACEDLLSALAIQQKHLDADNRLIAETHYTLGLASGLAKDFENSIKHYLLAVSVIEARIASLNKLVEEKEVNAENKENQEDDPLKKYKDEIKDLRELLPEMQNKIEDAKVEQKDMANMMEMAKAALGLSSVSTGFSSVNTKTEKVSSADNQNVDENGEKRPSNINHLARKKRKPEETDAPPEVDTKKVCKEGAMQDDDVSMKEDKANGITETCTEDTPAAETVKS